MRRRARPSPSSAPTTTAASGAVRSRFAENSSTSSTRTLAAFRTNSSPSSSARSRQNSLHLPLNPLSPFLPPRLKALSTPLLRPPSSTPQQRGLPSVRGRTAAILTAKFSPPSTSPPSSSPSVPTSGPSYGSNTARSVKTRSKRSGRASRRPSSRSQRLLDQRRAMKRSSSLLGGSSRTARTSRRRFWRTSRRYFSRSRSRAGRERWAC